VLWIPHTGKERLRRTPFAMPSEEFEL